MPLFHSNALHGRVGAVDRAPARRSGLGRRFSASGWLARRPPLRRRRTSTTRASRWRTSSRTPEQPDDADNPLRVAFGNEGSPEVVDAFARRFGVEVIDAYGATEGGVAVNRDAEQRAGALGQVGRRTSRSSTRTATRSRARRFDADGRLRQRRRVRRRDREHRRRRAVRGLLQQRRGERARRCASAGTGRATSATSTTTATSTSPAATPTGSASTARTSRPARSRTRSRATPTSSLAAVYGVPDDQAGDQVMAGLVLRDGARSTRPRSRAWLDAQADDRARSGGRATCASCATRRRPARTRS